MNYPVFLVSLLLCVSMTIVTQCEGRLVDGIFTEPTLKPGYNLVATVPKGATALNVTQLRHTQNYLAIKLRDGTFLLNGNYNINWSGDYKVAGTTLTYIRQSPQHLESFSAAGPLQEPIDVMVLYQEPNPGIVYRYIIHGGTKALSNGLPAAAGLDYTTVGYQPVAQVKKIDVGNSMIGDQAIVVPAYARRYRKRKFAWKANGLTECSKSCGGGFQTKRYICIREHNQKPVPEKRCHALEKPLNVQLRCNVKPCPPVWREGPWSECSVSCGVGVWTRELECVQEVTSSLTVRVADGACMGPKTRSLMETCHKPPCEDSYNAITYPSDWQVGPWSPCSTTCGPGRRTRTVACSSNADDFCDSQEKPVSQENCDLGPCSFSNSTSSNSTGSEQWLYTDWPEQCSSECGTGVQTRKVFCANSEDAGACNNATRPDSSRSCLSNKTCSGQWFTGPWAECSTSCDEGEQVRDVVCVTMIHGAFRVVLEMNCPVNKPESRRSCRGPQCTSTWFTSDWSECSRSCGKGVQKREVKCLTASGRVPEFNDPLCREADRPIGQRFCNDYPCRGSRISSNKSHDHRPGDTQNDPGVVREGKECLDVFQECVLVKQARLCDSEFYKLKCCLSCGG